MQFVSMKKAVLQESLCHGYPGIRSILWLDDGDNTVEHISEESYDCYQKKAEQKNGRYMPGSLFRNPNFIPGAERESLPLNDEYVLIKGWIDEQGPHQTPEYRAHPFGRYRTST
jgi:hypothetical protein